jgi:hypothetical protein
MHYDFAFILQSSAGDHRTGELVVDCSRRLHCQPLTQKVSLSNPKLKKLSVDLEEEGLNSAEIDLSLKLSDGTTLNASRPLNFGLWNSVESIGSDFPREIMGGKPANAHLWLEGAGGAKLTPTTVVQLTVISRDGCAQLRTQKAVQTPLSIASFWAAIDIPSWNNETLDTLSVAPNIWGNSVCNLEVAAESAGERKALAFLKLTIKPNYWPAFAFCLIGAFAQYVLAGMVQVVLATRANQKVSFLTVFVGSNAVEIIEPALKGVIAFVISYVLNTTEIVQFKGADSSSFIGFFVFGFLIGFWQLKPLWDAIKKLSSAPTASTPPPPPAPIASENAPPTEESAPQNS